MSTRTWEKIGAAGAIGYAGLSGVGWLLFERFGAGNPESSVPAAQLAEYFQQHQTSLRIAAACFSLALLPYMLFLARLRDVLAPPRDDTKGLGPAWNVLWASSIAGAVIPFVFMTFFWGFAYRPGETSPAVIQLCYDLCLLTGPAGFALWAAMLGAVAYLALKGGGLPRWLGISAIAAAVFQFLYIGDGFTDSGLFDGNDGLLGVYLPYGGYMLWILVTGIAWAVGVGSGSAATEESRGPAPTVPATVLASKS